MGIYEKDREDRTMIPRSLYDMLRDVYTRRNVVLETIKADKYLDVKDICRMLASPLELDTKMEEMLPFDDGYAD